MTSRRARALRERSIRRTTGVLASLVLLAALAVPAAADTRDELEDQQEQNELEQEQVASALEGTTTELADTYLALDDINRRLPIAESELAIANSELAAAERHRDDVQARLAVARQQQDDLEAEIAQGETDIASTNDAMGEVARSAYRGGGEELSTLTLILGSGSAEEFAQDYSAVNSALRSQNQTLTDLEVLQAVNRNQQVRLVAVEDRVVELEAEAQDAVSAADAARESAASLLAEVQQLKVDQEVKAGDLEEQRVQFEDEQSQLEQENDALAEEIAEIARQEAAERERQREAAREREREAAREREREAERQRQAEQDQEAAPEPAPDPEPAPEPEQGGGGGGATFGPPISRSLYVTSPYGYRVYPINGGYFFHQGVDLRSGCGEPQTSAAAGTVVAVKPVPNGTHGNQVMVNHGVIDGNSWLTVYNHLSSFAVSTGDRVAQGQTVGYTGATGMVTGCHVHYEMWRNGTTVDPMDYY